MPCQCVLCLRALWGRTKHIRCNDDSIPECEAQNRRSSYIWHPAGWNGAFRHAIDSRWHESSPRNKVCESLINTLGHHLRPGVSAKSKGHADTPCKQSGEPTACVSCHRRAQQDRHRTLHHHRQALAPEVSDSAAQGQRFSLA